MLRGVLLKKKKEAVEKALPVRFKDATSFERTGLVRQIVVPTSLYFYSGEPKVAQYFAVQDQTPATRERVLFLATSLVQPGQHPILQAIARAGYAAGVQPRETEVDTVSELGTIGRIDRSWFVLGDEKVIAQEEIEPGIAIQKIATQFELEGKYTIYLAQQRPKRLLGIFACEYSLAPKAAETIRELRAQDVEPVLLTEVKTSIAKGIGKRLGISLIHSELTQSEKQRVAKSLIGSEQAPALVIANGTKVTGALTIGVGVSADIEVESFSDLPAVFAEVKKALHQLRHVPF